MSAAKTLKSASNQHTPGPWSLSKNRVATHSPFYIQAGNKVIAELADHYWSRAHNQVPIEQESNAALIVASPDMLECLETLEAMADADKHSEIGRLFRQYPMFRDALAKARGES